MKTINGKLIEATEAEIMELWLVGGYDDILSFPDFLARTELLGTKVIKEEPYDKTTDNRL